MLCIASFIVLLVLSVFSARFRPYVREAYDCVFRRLTFRPCTTGFDVKVRSTIASRIAMHSERLARWFLHYFEVVSWLFVVSFFVSLLWTLRGGYLFWTTGSCNGLNQGGFCVLDPGGKNNAVSSTGAECRTGGNPTGNLTIEDVAIPKTPIVFIGCYACKYSKQTYPLIKTLGQRYSTQISFVFYPAHPEAEYLMKYDYAIKNLFPDRYLEWVDAMYAVPLEKVGDEQNTLQVIRSLGLDSDQLTALINSPETIRAAQKQVYEIDKTGIYGTPTIFINGKPVVGPKPPRVYRIMLNGSLF